MSKYLVLIIICFKVFSQEISPIQSFNMDDYSANGQNWMITQSDDDSMFFANNDGLLTYNGNLWSLYKTPNNYALHKR